MSPVLCSLSCDQEAKKPKTRKVNKSKQRETREQRSVAFSKRRYGLFNKAAEFCMIGDANVAILVSAPAEYGNKKRKIYSFGHPSVDHVLNEHLGAQGKRVDAARSVVRVDDDGMKESAVSLSVAIKKLENELKYLEDSSGVERRKKGFVATDVSIREDLEGFERSESVDELMALLDGLQQLVDTRINSHPISPDSVLGFGDIDTGSGQQGINDGFSVDEPLFLTCDNSSPDPDFIGDIILPEVIHTCSTYLPGICDNSFVDNAVLITNTEPEPIHQPWDLAASEFLDSEFDSDINSDMHFNMYSFAPEAEPVYTSSNLDTGIDNNVFLHNTDAMLKAEETVPWSSTRIGNDACNNSSLCAPLQPDNTLAGTHNPAVTVPSLMQQFHDQESSRPKFEEAILFEETNTIVADAVSEIDQYWSTYNNRLDSRFFDTSSTFDNNSSLFF